MIQFVAFDSPVHSINPILQEKLRLAQNNLLEHRFANAQDFLSRVIADVGLVYKAPASLATEPASFVANLQVRDLDDFLHSLLVVQGVEEHKMRLPMAALAERVRLVTAFDDADGVVRGVVEKVGEIVENFPKTAKDILCGNNPGDVLDPFILAATKVLMFGGNLEATVGATVAHKALMMVEGLLGHLHEDVIGQMRGNVRVPEPRGKDQETLNPEVNPFPGSDVLQPPYFDGDCFKFHQIKSKTGSAKGGDGRRLGEQLDRLRVLYGGQIFYHALIGNTLRGHRSKAGVERAAPEVVVLVGRASFNCLTRTVVGPELLLRLYNSAFATIAARSGYRVDVMAAAIVAHFVERAQDEGEGFLDVVLEEATEGPAEEQDSRLFNVRVKASRKRGALTTDLF